MNEEVKTEKKEPKAKEKTEGKVFTYVGAGESSPAVIQFMGQHEFVRGEAREVTCPHAIKKLTGNPSFVEGKADARLLHKIDTEAVKAAEKQRKIDTKKSQAFTKKHKTADKDE